MITPNRRPVKKSFRLMRLAKLTALFLGLILIWNLSIGLVEIKTAYSRLTEAKTALKLKEERYRELQDKLVEVKKDDYLERVARDKLAMQKPAETVVLLEGESRVKQNESKVEVPGEPEEAFYQRWWRLIR